MLTVVVLLMATDGLMARACFLVWAWKARVQTLPLTRFTACTRAAQVDFMPVYAAHLRGIIQKGIAHPDNPERPLEGFKIVVDAGNGSGGFLATDVLAPLGADTTGATGLLPACSPGPQTLKNP